MDGASTESSLSGFVVTGFVVAGFVVTGFVVADGLAAAGFVVAVGLVVSGLDVSGLFTTGFVVAVGLPATELAGAVGSDDDVDGRVVTAPGNVLAGRGTEVREASGASSFFIVDDVGTGLLSFFLAVLEVGTEPLPEPLPDPFGLEAKTGVARHKTLTPQRRATIRGLRRME